jgi:hypothetical protein
MPGLAKAPAAARGGQHTPTGRCGPAPDAPAADRELDGSLDDVRSGGRRTTVLTDSAAVMVPGRDVVERVRATRAAQGLTLGVQEAALLEGLRRILFRPRHAR